MRTIACLFISFFISLASFSQNEALAKNYFNQGEYEKAITIFKKLAKKNKRSLKYTNFLVKAYQELENYEEAEKLINERLTGRRIYPQYLVELGHNYSLQDKDSLASVNYQKAIKTIEENPFNAYMIGQALTEYNLLEEAATAYEMAMKLNPDRDYNSQLAKIYGEQGKLDKMFITYINLIKNKPTYRSTAQRLFSAYVTEDPANEGNIILRKTLLKQLQDEPETIYNELLSWLFIQQKDFKKAFIQEKAIYKRSEENTTRIVDLLRIAIDEKSFVEAKDIVTFLIDKATTPNAKLIAYQYAMNIELQLATPKDYANIDKQFRELFDTYGLNRDTYLLQIDYNHFLAFKYGKKEDAIANLKTLSKQRLTPHQEARVKLKLADILVFDEKFNEALIYYSQVQKKVKSDVLAQEARFKVAQTSYFKGDFEWAQIQLNILKKSASQLIANDAMQLFLMIRDNSLEDSTQTALKKFARADLLTFQNRDQEAITILTDILTNHKGEKIEDEALLKMGEVYEKLGNYTSAEKYYIKLIELYKEEILADDAHFKLANLYENYLDEHDQAKELYEQIIFNFADSIYFVEARKRYRMLRGDAIN